MTAAAPLLESLSIRNITHQAEMISLPSSLLGGAAPRLRNLRLWNCDLLCSSLFHDLTSLDIVGVSFGIAEIILLYI
jgi:hypothetical protein